MYSQHLQKSIDEFEHGLQDGSPLMDCLWGELYGSINSDFWSGLLTKEQADELRKKYLFADDTKSDVNLNQDNGQEKLTILEEL